MLKRIFPSFSPSLYMGSGVLSCAESTAFAIPPKKPVFSVDATGCPFLSSKLALQKSQETRGAFPDSSLGGKAFALVSGILHCGQEELKQYVSCPYFITLTAPLGFVALSTRLYACVSTSDTLPSSLGKSLTVIPGTVTQFIPIEPVLDEALPPPPPNSFLKDPRPRFIVIVDRLVDTPKGA